MNIMREVITNTQKSDMGNGYGYVEGADGCTLDQILAFYENNTKTWGTVSIYHRGDIIRRFDYDTYNRNIFYHHLSGFEYHFIVKEVKFLYCYMEKDIDIYLD